MMNNHIHPSGSRNDALRAGASSLPSSATGPWVRSLPHLPPVRLSAPAVEPSRALAMLVSAACYLSLQQGPADPSILEAVGLLHSLAAEVQQQHGAEVPACTADALWQHNLERWERVRRHAVPPSSRSAAWQGAWLRNLPRLVPSRLHR